MSLVGWTLVEYLLDLGHFEKRHMIVNIPDIVSYLRAFYQVSVNSLMNIWNETIVVEAEATEETTNQNE